MKTTIEFSARAADELNRLSDSLHASKADVIRDALALYSYVIKELESKRGRNLAIVEDNDSTIKKVIVVPGMGVPA